MNGLGCLLEEGSPLLELSILIVYREPGTILPLRCMLIEQLSQRGDGGSDDDDANDGGDTAARKQKP